MNFANAPPFFAAAALGRPVFAGEPSLRAVAAFGVAAGAAGLPALPTEPRERAFAPPARALGPTVETFAVLVEAVELLDEPPHAASVRLDSMAASDTPAAQRVPGWI
jgi:hypothetical protein